MGDVHVKMVTQERSVMYVLMGFTKNRMLFNIYAQVSLLWLCKFFSFVVEVQEISGNCGDVFGKNGKYTLYFDVRHFIEFCFPRNKSKQIFRCLRRIDFPQVLQIFSFRNPL